MECPKCSYIFQPFETTCPRCAHLGERAVAHHRPIGQVPPSPPSPPPPTEATPPAAPEAPPSPALAAVTAAPPASPPATDWGSEHAKETTNAEKAPPPAKPLEDQFALPTTPPAANNPWLPWLWLLFIVVLIFFSYYIITHKYKGRIAYTMKSGDLGTIYVANPDGLKVKQITNDTNMNQSPCFNPDGTRIVYTATDKGDSRLWVMETDGSNPHKILKGLVSSQPNWSPDGIHIAFVCTADNGGTDICQLDTNSGKVTWMTKGANAYQPSYSPNGQQLVFASNSGIARILTHGGPIVQLTDKASDACPRFDKTGQRIAFVRDGAIYTMNSSGYHQAKYYAFRESIVSFAWSPDGQELCFSSAANRLYTTNYFHLLTTPTGFGYDVDWSHK